MKLAIFMAMSTAVNIAEFKDRLSEFLHLVEQGGELVICRRNVPVVKLEPIRNQRATQAAVSPVGCMKGSVQILGDVTEPGIPDSDWEMFR